MYARSHVQNTDKKWMLWLRNCSKRIGISDRTLYEEYCDEDNGAWHGSVALLKSQISDGWQFCRGASDMTSVDIASARSRYLDKYPLTYEEKSAITYVDTLLEIDDAQTALRQALSHAPTCDGCRERDRTISVLRTALSAPAADDRQIDRQMISAVFRRYFMLDSSSTTSRTEVRETIESVLKREIGSDETLPSTSPLWSAFLRNTLGTTGASNGPIRCRLRSTPIEPHVEL